MAFKQQHKTDESTTNDMKLFRNCDSGEENPKHNSETPTKTGPLLQYAERPLLNFSRGRYVPLPPPPPTPQEGLRVKF